jgi:hypothetical protein
MTLVRRALGRLGLWPRESLDPREQALLAYGREVRAACAGTDIDSPESRARVRTLIDRPALEGWPDELVELELEQLHAVEAAWALSVRIERQGLPVVPTQHRVIGPDRCHFTTPAFLANDGPDRTGRLFLTNRRVVFGATPPVSIAWERTRRIDADGRDLRVEVPGLTYVFRCNGHQEARCAALVAGALRRAATTPGAGRPPAGSGTGGDDPPGPR